GYRRDAQTAPRAASSPLSCTPNAAYHRSSPTRRSSDLGGANETANITVNVAPVADIVADVVNTNEDTAVTFNPVSGLNEVSGADNFEGTATIIQINGTAITTGGPGVTVDHGTVKIGRA